jgi:hypothetical protein
VDRAIGEKFQNNPDDQAVREQAIKLIRIFRASKSHAQVIVDVLHAAHVSHHDSKDGIAEIGFAMGLQFGFELGLSYPPLPNR